MAMKIDIVKNGTFEVGDCHVVGKLPESKPYVWIGDNNVCLAVLDKRQMNLLNKQWAQANKACIRRVPRRGVKAKTRKASRQLERVACPEYIESVRRTGLCPECDSEILPTHFCMMGHWCSEPPRL
jgi:hypothetical protein